MANQPGVWGIDIGQCAFKAIRLENIEGTVTATAFDYIEHAKILSQPDADADVLTREALDKFLERNTLRGDHVVIGIPGQSGLARFVKLPPVEEKKINDIVRFEAKQQIPFPLDEVIWDYQKIGTGLVTDGFAMETEIGLFAMKRDMIHRFMQHFLDVKIEVHVVQMAPLALCNFISFELLGKNPLKTADAAAEGDGSTAIQAAPDAGGKKQCVVALDIGADNSNLVITDGDRIIWQRPIPLGGNHFTRALTKEMKLTFAKAEHLKRNATKSPDLKKILASLKPVLNEFVGEVQRSLGYFTNTHRDAKVEYMMGLGNAFRLPGLQKYLSEKLSLDVRKLGNFNQVSGETIFNVPAFSNNAMSFAMAYGLAVQGLNLARIHTNLLPQEIRIDRQIRAKKPWAVATGAAFIAGIAASLAGYSMQFNAVAGAPVVAEISQDESLLKQIQGANGAYATQETAVKNNENAIKNFIAGQDERLNWIMLNRFINECLPVPAQRTDGKLESLAADGKCVVLDGDGKKQDFTIDDKAVFLMKDDKFVLDAAEKSKLKKGDTVAVVYQTDAGAKLYWGKPDQLEAYRAYWKRQCEGKNSAETRLTEDGIDDLIQINIESVFTMYTTDLGTYFGNLQRTYTNYQERMIEKAPKPPEGKGWVVELRGYTYNKGKEKFLLDTLTTAVATKAAKKVEDPAAAGAAPASGADPAAAAGKPAESAAAKPAETPAAKPGDAAATPAKDASTGAAKDAAAEPAKEGEAKPAEKKPDPYDTIITGRVSTVVLAEYHFDDKPLPGQFKYITEPIVPSLLQSMAMGGGGEGAAGAVAPGAGGAGGPAVGSAPPGAAEAGGGPMGPGGPGATSWSPLTGDAAGTGMPGMGGGAEVGPGRRSFGGGFEGGPRGRMGGGFNPGMGGGAGARAMASGGSMPGGPGAGPVGPGVLPDARASGPARSEFILLFIWQEPTPSDDRMEGGGAGGAPAPAPPTK